MRHKAIALILRRKEGIYFCTIHPANIVN